MTPTEEFVNRYKETAKEADSLGRLITVGRLRPSQKLRIAEMTPGLDGEIEMKTDDGNTITIARRAQPIIAAHVRSIGENPWAFPRNRGELDTLMDVLDEPGLQAAIRAIAKLSPIVTVAEDVDEHST